MSYSLKHLQQTAHYIVNRCQYSSGELLSHSGKKHLHNEVVVALLDLSYRNTVMMVINPGNGALDGLFSALSEDKIVFPENTTYLIQSTGESYEKVSGDKTKIYDCKEVKYNRGADQKYRAIRDLVKPPLLSNYDENEKILEPQTPTYLTTYERNQSDKALSKQISAERDDKTVSYYMPIPKSDVSMGY